MEENRLYTIGKISSMMGISIQTLRFYEKIGLLEPRFVNPETGYRYYEYSQMHMIDRIRYFQKLGISLKDIKEIFYSKNANEILEHLRLQHHKERQVYEESRNRLEELEWYIEYFSFLKDQKFIGIPYQKHFDKRIALVVDMGINVRFSESNERFYRLRNDSFYGDLECRRKYVYILDDAYLRKQQAVTLQYGLYLKEDPGIRDAHIIELPEGEYICFLAPIYHQLHQSEEELPTSALAGLMKDNRSYLVVADEYESNLYNYEQSIWEIQIIEKP